MDLRSTMLESDIENLQTRPVYYIEQANIDYMALNKQFALHPKMWHELVPPKVVAKPPPKGPNFKALLKGVVASKRREIKQGTTLKVRFVTPGEPRGYWVKTGDTINGMKVIDITPAHIVFEKHQNDKRYTYKHARK
jgi:hypothetical protein